MCMAGGVMVKKEGSLHGWFSGRRGRFITRSLFMEVVPESMSLPMHFTTPDTQFSHRIWNITQRSCLDTFSIFLYNRDEPTGRMRSEKLIHTHKHTSTVRQAAKGIYRSQKKEI